MAMLPTPPLAPVTTIGPIPGVWPLISIRYRDSAAVNPAVPMAIVSNRVRPAGSGTSQSAGTRTSSANPPS